MIDPLISIKLDIKPTANNTAEVPKAIVKEHVFDKRNGSEWFYRVDKNGNPDKEEAMVEEWKCPYHNGRMCMEMIRAEQKGEL